MKTNCIYLSLFQAVVEIILSSIIYTVNVYKMYKETPFKNFNAMGVNTCFQLEL